MLTEEITAYFVVVEAVSVVFTLWVAVITFVADRAKEMENVMKGAFGEFGRDKQYMCYFVARQPAWISYIFGKKRAVRCPEVPTVDNLIQTGDRLMFTSSMFDHIRSSRQTSQEISWVKLYTQFFHSMAWLLPFQTASAKRNNKDIKKYLEMADERVRPFIRAHETTRSESTIAPKDEETGIAPDTAPTAQTVVMKPGSKTPVRHCLFLEHCKGAAILVSCVLPLEADGSDEEQRHPALDLSDVRPLRLVDGKLCIEVSSEEVAGLALSLGIPLLNRRDSSISGTGPFGTHLIVARDITHWKLRLTRLTRLMHHHRQIDNDVQYGSGYSTLFAKHMACNCLPLDLSRSIKEGGDDEQGERQAKNLDTVRCIHVDPGFVQWIRSSKFAQVTRGVKGGSDEEEDDQRERSPLQEVVGTPEELAYLYHLPTAYKINVLGYSHNIFHGGVIQGPAEENPKSIETTHWFKAVASIAFGGLVPQAGKSLVNAVLFTVTGEYREDCELDGDYDLDEEELSTDKESNAESEDSSPRPTRRDHSFDRITASRIHASPSRHHFVRPRRLPLSFRMRRNVVATMAGPQVLSKAGKVGNTSSPLTMALQLLVDALHKDCYHRHGFKLFGDNVHRRARRKSNNWLDHDTAIPSEPRYTGALFSRYMTALERLVAISISGNYDRIVQEDRANGEKFGIGTVERGVAADSELFQKSKPSVRPSEVEPRSYVRRIYQRCVQLLLANFGDKKNTWDLMVCVNGIRTEKIESKRLGITLEDCANVARCIIACWALRVPAIELECEASGRLQNASFNELPYNMAFG